MPSNEAKTQEELIKNDPEVENPAITESLEPLQDFIACVPHEQNMTRGGLFIPTGMMGRNNKLGLVVKTGPGKDMPDGTISKMFLKANDVIVLPQIGLSTVSIQGKEYFLLRQNEVQAKIANSY